VNESAKSIVLIGMMGAGKSSVGRCLQRRTGLICFDTDEMISSRFDLPIPEIFSKFGEKEFREVETDILANLTPSEPAIIVTGGGIVLRTENVEHLKRLGLVVWLQADENTLFERASRRGNRPLLKTHDPQATLAEMLQKRSPIYAAAADVQVETTARDHEEVADMILAEIEKRITG
jgi:shikimate kinase